MFSSLKFAVSSVIFPVLVSSYDLKALLHSSEDHTDLLCRYIFFTYVATFLVVVVTVHVYASVMRPEKRQYTYSMSPPNNSDRENEN